MGRYTVVGNNNSDKQGILNLLRKYIFGKDQILFYDPTKTYNAGDNVYTIDPSTGELKIITALEDGITGDFNNNKWTDTIDNLSGQVIVISNTEPTSQSVQMWLYPASYSKHLIDMPDPNDPDVDPDEPTIDDPIYDTYTSVNLILETGTDIPVVDQIIPADLSYLEMGDIVIDTENIEVINNIHGLTTIDASGDAYIDDQDDIHVSANPPSDNDESFLWIDTDTSDD